jgi:hypothetical protein
VLFKPTVVANEANFRKLFIKRDSPASCRVVVYALPILTGTGG